MRFMNEHGLVNIYMFMVTYLLCPEPNDYENAEEQYPGRGSPQDSGTDDELEMSEIRVANRSSSIDNDVDNERSSPRQAVKGEREFFNKKVLNRKD